MSGKIIARKLEEETSIREKLKSLWLKNHYKQGKEAKLINFKENIPQEYFSLAVPNSKKALVPNINFIHFLLMKSRILDEDVSSFIS